MNSKREGLCKRAGLKTAENGKKIKKARDEKELKERQHKGQRTEKNRTQGHFSPFFTK